MAVPLQTRSLPVLDVHIKVQLADVDGGCGASGRCHAATTVPTAAPTWAVAPAGIVGSELLFTSSLSIPPLESLASENSRR